MAARSTIKPDQFLDPRWRLSNLYYITDKTGKEVKFVPNTAQLEFLENVHSQNIILKARQLGFTTLCCLIYLDAAVFNKNTRAAIIAHKLDDAKVILRDKVKFPFDHLPEELKGRLKTKQNSADTLTLANNSSIRVTTSGRSGTLQYLHISEFGKICAQYPDRAREIVTGALNTIQAGQFVAIESTAEGQEGRFYEMCQEAMSHKRQGKPLTDMDFKFHFFPWFEDDAYQVVDESVEIDAESAGYFEKLEGEGIKLTLPQKRWWVKKEAVQQADMKREYPATPDEAFEQALEGAYYSRELAIAEKFGRIGSFPLIQKHPVNTFWDLGRNDFNTIWLHQDVDGFDRFIGYYENSGEYIGHYITWLKEWAAERGAILGEHYVPHDGDRQSLWLPDGTLSVMSDLGFRPNVVERPSNKMEAISRTRTKFPTCQFDRVGCGLGLKRLKHYRKEWDSLRGVWKDRPLHDDNSHGADGFQTFACSGHKPVTAQHFPQPTAKWTY